MSEMRSFARFSACAASVWLANGLSTAVLAQNTSVPVPEVSQVSNNDMADTVNDPRIAAAQKSHMGTWKWVVPPVK